MNLGLGSLSPTEVGAAKNSSQKAKAAANNAQGQPSEEQDQFRFGIVTNVNKHNLATVKFLNANGEPEGQDIAEGSYLSIITPLNVINHLYGSLRKGLMCRIWFKGKLKPKAASTFIEIIGDEDFSFLKKEPEDNEITIGPYRIFSGGLLG